MNPAVLVAALGYFVDIYDLVLFSVLRVTSLRDLGLSPEEVTNQGVALINAQMIGMLLGGILWGIIGDKRGRLSVLFGSIFLYSVANILNGFATTIEQYWILRLLAGIGLAGELGAGITLVSETLPKETRGYGTTIVASVGVSGAVLAALIGEHFHWRTSYFVGGGLGLALFVLRIAVHESGMFRALAASNAARGNLLLLFRSRERVLRYLACIACGLPIWYIVGILITFSPELGLALGMTETPSAGTAILFCYVGLVVGDLSSGVLSQYLRSRRRCIMLFQTIAALSVVLYTTLAAPTLSIFYAVCTLLGFGAGYWAVFVTSSAEQFGTNLRATVATTTPNFVRGAVVPFTWAFRELRLSDGPIIAAVITGGVAFVVAALGGWYLNETFGRDLDFIEE